MVIAEESASASAMAFVPFAKCGHFRNAHRPIQITVFALLISLAKMIASTVRYQRHRIRRMFSRRNDLRFRVRLELLGYDKNQTGA